MQALARQVEDQSHEESELWSTSKPLAKLEKGLAKLSVVRWRETKHFARQNHQIRKVCQNLQGVPNFGKMCQNSQGVPNFGKVCQTFAGCAKISQGVRKSLCAHRPTRFFSRTVIFPF